MAAKAHLNEVISLKIKNRRTPICGVVLDYNDVWTLMKYNPVDYVIDGYILVRNKKVSAFRKEEEELFKQKILSRKGELSDTLVLPLSGNESALLSFIQGKYRLLHFETKSENVAYIGSISVITPEHITISLLNTQAQKADPINILISDLVVIQFDNDYVNSLKLVMEPE